MSTTSRNADIAGSNGQRTEFNAVGRATVPGRLSYSIATGKAKFGTDTVLPDMLHAKFLRSPYGRAKIRSIDISRAKALAGVVDIITWDNPKVLRINPGLTNPEVPTMAGIHGLLIPNQAEAEDEEVGAVEESTIGDQGAPEETVSPMMGFEARFSPFNTTRCVNQKSRFQAVFTNSGRNTLSQTSPFNWDAMTIAEQIVAEKTRHGRHRCCAQKRSWAIIAD